ncbi:HupE/UreJ family protein [Candidatus Nitrospira nitrificans]|nr:HupE/UreJ family protein [Candidatus Nitrospira nitrificans]
MTSGCSKRPLFSSDHRRCARFARLAAASTPGAAKPRAKMRLSAGKAAASEEVGHTPRYVESLSYARTATTFLSILLVIAWLLPTLPAWAHKPSDSYLSLSVQNHHIEGRWDIALRDLDDAIGLDSDGNGQLTWGEVRNKHDEIRAYSLSRLALSADKQVCMTQALEQLIDHHTDGAYAVLHFRADCGDPIERLAVNYRLLFDMDAQHKGLLRLTQGGQTSAAVFSRESPTHEFSITERSRWAESMQFIHEGIWHIWMGFDHVLFLLALLLPAVLIQVEGRWQAVTDFSSVWWNVVGIVTAFTVAHSLTLSLAAFDIVRLPSRLVESTIAASVVLAGLGNLYPTMMGRRWMIAFGFGLIHGFGFAAVLTDLGLPQDSLLLSLLSFNLGVEIGQLAIVAAFLPLAYLIRRSWSYPRLVLTGGSLAVIAIALVWFTERAFDLQLLLF